MPDMFRLNAASYPLGLYDKFGVDDFAFRHLPGGS